MDKFRKITSAIDSVVSTVMGASFNIPETETVKKYPYLMTYR